VILVSRVMIMLWPALASLVLPSAPLAPSRATNTRMQFGNFKNPFADKADGATTIALTIGFNCMERGPKSILGQLDSLAAAADTSTTDGIAGLCGDTALALLRRSSEWVSCSGSAEHKGEDDDALAAFDRLVIKEAAKFDDRPTSATVDAALAAAGVGAGGAATVTPKPTIAVVCVIACIMGDREEEVSKDFQGDAAKLQAALQELAAAGNGDEEVFAFELLWVPGGDDEVLDSDEIMLDWPELMPC